MGSPSVRLATYLPTNSHVILHLVSSDPWLLATSLAKNQVMIIARGHLTDPGSLTSWIGRGS